jgi:hypothetical protein
LHGSSVNVLNHELQVLRAVALVDGVAGGVTQRRAASIALVDGDFPFA